MKIEVKYSTSQGPHLVNITLNDIRRMYDSGCLSVEHDTPTGTKTVTIEGTQEELYQMAQLLLSCAKE